jgi:tetratricopeptide (TPR) repeat protein
MEAGKNDAAVQAFTRALRGLGTDERNYQVAVLTRAQAHLRKGDHQGAWSDASHVVKSGAADEEMRAVAFMLRGIILLKRNQDEKAMEEFTRAIKTSHQDMALRSDSFAKRGAAYLGFARYDDALSDLNQALRLNPQSAQAYAARAMLYLRLDDIPKARRDAETALKLSPDESAAKTARKVLESLGAAVAERDHVSVPMGSDGHLFVEVRFGERGKPRRFLFDTGATHSLISKDLLEAIKEETIVTKVGEGRVMIADGSMHNVKRYVAKNAYLYNLPLGDVEVHVFANGARKVTSLLGAKSLKNITVAIKPAAGKAEIRRVDSAEGRAGRVESR